MCALVTGVQTVALPILRMTAPKPGAGVGAVIRKCATLFSREDEESGAPHPFRYGDIRDEVLDYEEELAKHVCRVPEILESYYANLVGGAYSEMRSEAPARYADDVAKFPERRVEFWKSAFSWRIGAPCYRSEEHTSELQSLMRISYAVF